MPIPQVPPEALRDAMARFDGELLGTGNGATGNETVPTDTRSSTRGDGTVNLSGARVTRRLGGVSCGLNPRGRTGGYAHRPPAPSIKWWPAPLIRLKRCGRRGS